MKGDIGMAYYEKQVEQEAAYPIPLSLYNCYRTVRHEKCYQEYSARREDDTFFIFSHFDLFLSNAASNSHK